MLIIRLTRRGRRNDPSFRLVVTERGNPIRGKFLEGLGFYNPKLKTKSFDKERILYWLGQGAKTSATVHNMLVDEGIISGSKVKTWRPKKKEGGEIVSSQEAVKTEAIQQSGNEEVEKINEAAKEESRTEETVVGQENISEK